jgi:hypothetical protein
MISITVIHVSLLRVEKRLRPAFAGRSQARRRISFSSNRRSRSSRMKSLTSDLHRCRPCFQTNPWILDHRCSATGLGQRSSCQKNPVPKSPFHPGRRRSRQTAPGRRAPARPPRLRLPCDDLHLRACDDLHLRDWRPDWMNPGWTQSFRRSCFLSCFRSCFLKPCYPSRHCLIDHDSGLLP